MSRRKARRAESAEIEYWQSSSDLMTGLILILLLVIIMLTFYIMQVPPEEYDGYKSTRTEGPEGHSASQTVTPTVTITPTVTPTITITPYPFPFMNNGGAGGDGGGGDGGGGDGGSGGIGYGQGEGDGNSGGNFDFEFQGIYPEEGKGNKAAVYAEVVDGETERLVRQEGVIFELYDVGGHPLTLHTYYPEMVSYENFVTEPSGTFYLPEKLPLGSYSLQQKTEIDGYDLSEAVTFTLEEDYDWNEPYVVTIYIYPSKNTVTVQQTDARTRKNVPGGIYEVVANGEVRTLDGTLRYANGQVAATLEVGKDGRGESDEIFLGNYTLRQAQIPQYYASLAEDVEVEVVKKGSLADGQIYNIACERSTLTVSLADELTGDPIVGAVFDVNHGDLQERFTTRSDGTFLIDTLEKTETYYIHQMSTIPGYYMLDESFVVDVSVQGRMSGQASHSIMASNRMIRVSILLRDFLFRTPISDSNIVLYRADGESVTSWTSTASPRVFTDLTVGEYYIVAGGDTAHKFAFEVKNEKEVQAVVANVFSRNDRMTLIVAAITSATLLVLLIKVSQVISRRRRLQMMEDEE